MVWGKRSQTSEIASSADREVTEEKAAVLGPCLLEGLQREQDTGRLGINGKQPEHELGLGLQIRIQENNHRAVGIKWVMEKTRTGAAVWG